MQTLEKARNNGPLKGFLALLSFLTIIPTRVHDIQLAARHFYLVPLVALIEGLIVALPLYTSLPLELKAVIALVLSYIITGFNHIDGFADFTDAIASRKRGKEALRMVKEPWKGPMAIVATVLLILIVYTSLTYLSRVCYYFIITSHVLAGEAMFVLAIISKRPEYPGLGNMFIVEAKEKHHILSNVLLTSVLLLLLTYVYYLGFSIVVGSLTMILAMMMAVLYTYVKAHSILGFSNGDVLGFCYELVKAVTLLVSVVSLSIISL